MQITADSFNHLFLILCSKLRISKFADLNFVLNVLMFVPYPQSIKSLHSNRALQGPGDQNGPKWETQFDIETAVEYFFTGINVENRKIVPKIQKGWKMRGHQLIPTTVKL